MTIKELKQKLDQFSDDMTVLVQGYEGGFSDISILKESKINLNFYDQDWNGPHEEDSKSDHSAIIIIREPNPNSKM